MFALLVGLSMSSLAFAQQFARPDGTIGSTADYSFSTTGYWQDVSEVTPDDGDFIDTTLNPGVIEFSLTNISDPGVDTGHILKFRSANPANNNKTVTISLYEGGTLIGENAIVVPKKTDAWAEYSYTIPTAVVGAYADLSIRLSGNGTVASPVQISWVELEIPNAVVTTAPTVTVQAAAVTGSSTATLNGNVTVNGSAADNDTFFKYGTTTLTYTVTTASAGTVTTGPFSLGLTGLTPNTTYYYIACATANEAGGLEGCSATEESFTTDPSALTAPTVTVQAAAVTGSSTATLNGNVTVNGSAADNDTYFKYGTTTLTYTVTTASAGTVTTGPFSLGVTGLTAEYHLLLHCLCHRQ